jgi:hypothetical protein
MESFSSAGPPVAILTTAMQMRSTVLACFLLCTLPALGQNWSLGIGSGPYVFGDFVERRVRPVSSGDPAGTVTYTLSAATRAGGAVDIEHSFSERWAVRVEGTFSKSPLTVQQQGTDAGFELDSGEMKVTTITLPLVFRINPRGTFRFHLMGGPAYAMYDITAVRVPAIPLSSQKSNEWGLAYGGGVGWWFSDSFAVEGNLTDVVTTSPFDNFEDRDVPGFKVPEPHNVHTSLGIRWRF